MSDKGNKLQWLPIYYKNTNFLNSNYNWIPRTKQVAQNKLKKGPKSYQIWENPEFNMPFPNSTNLNSKSDKQSNREYRKSKENARNFWKKDQIILPETIQEKRSPRS